MATVRKLKEERDEIRTLVNEQYRNLFSAQDTPPAPINIREMEALKARVATLEAELEGRVEESQAPTLPEAPPPVAQTMSEALTEQPATERPATEEPATEQPAPVGSALRSVLTRLGRSMAMSARQFGRSAVQVRLTALILLVTVPVLIGVTAFISASAEARIEASANQALQHNTDGMATNISTWLDQNVRTLREMVSLPTVVSMRAWAQEPVLKAVAAAHPYMYLVSTTDLTGMNVARNDGAKATDYKDRVWYQNAAAGSDLTFQTLIGRTSGRPALVASVPIRTSAGAITGVGMFAADLTHLSEETRVQTLGKTGYVYLLDADNNVLAHPDPAFTTGELRNLSEYPPVAALREGKTGLITFTDENGTSWRAYGRTLDNGWAVITQQQDAEILAPARDFQRVAYALIAIGTLFMLSLLWFSIRRTLQPIGVLTDAASAIAAGDLNRNIEVTSRDELGVLARTFNSMTVQLRSMVATLEQRVSDRTHDLELAADVGRAVSEKASDIDTLLKDAVESIRQRFGLYYAQIYLADPAVRTLTLRAGTGEAGAELLRRGHHLVVGPESLNGRAASEKQAVIVADTQESPSFLPNPLLPHTRSEMAIPLIASGQVLGVLDMQSEQPGGLTTANLPAFEVLAGQLAVALQNSALLADASEARAQVAEQLRHLSEQGWQEFLDAIEHGQRTGFAVERGRVVPLDEVPSQIPADVNSLEVPIALAGTRLGAIHLNRERDHAWQDWEEQVANGAAGQLAQHLEGLRLLGRAERYRALAEESARRLTGEGWEAYGQRRRGAAAGYEYDLNEVQPISGGHNGGTGAALTQPLVVRNQTIGEFGADVSKASDEVSELMAAVAERTSIHIETLRLTEELQKRAAELQELDRLKTAFLANMSHELRTPLNSILGFTDVILEELDGPLTENMNNDLQLIQKNGQHLLHLINDVLDMAKIEAGRMNLNPEKFRVHDVIQDAMSIVAPMAQAKALALVLEDTSDRQVEIEADRTRIQQVMLNLVSNAVKFTDTGKVGVAVARHGEKVVISVRDTGVGIPKDHLDRVFQEFTQVDTSETRKAGGTGLGLPISRRLIEMHGGRMWVESTGRPGDGATFFVELPIESMIVEATEGAAK